MRIVGLSHRLIDRVERSDARRPDPNVSSRIVIMVSVTFSRIVGAKNVPWVEGSETDPVAVAFAPFARASVDMGGDGLQLLACRYRTDVDLEIHIRSRPEFLYHRPEEGHEWFIDGALNVDPLDPSARLSCVGKAGPRRSRRCTVEVGIRTHDHRVIPAQLQRHGSEPPGSRCHQGLADRDRAREEQLVDARINERIACNAARNVQESGTPRREAPQLRHSGRSRRQ